MLYTLAAIVVALIALFVAFKAVQMLWKNSWFIGFCRGLFGLSILTLGVFIALMAFDIYSYKQVLQDQAIATINFQRIEKQYYSATLVDKEGNQKIYNIRGDQWQLDARIIKWKGYFASLGIKPAFRLERISGRYYDLEQETTAKRTAFDVFPSLYGVDLWEIFNQHPGWVPVIDAIYGSATYLPMKDGALFEVSLSNSGILARPLNEAARKAVDKFN